MGFSDLLLGKKKLDSQQEKSHKAPEKVAEKSSLFGSIGRAIREKIHGIIPKKEIETVITKEASPALSLKQLRSFSPEFIVKTFVIDPKLKEQYLAELSYNIEHNGMEKAQIMLLYQLFKNNILPIREEEKEHLAQLFRGDIEMDTPKESSETEEKFMFHKFRSTQGLEKDFATVGASSDTKATASPHEHHVQHKKESTFGETLAIHSTDKNIRQTVHNLILEEHIPHTLSEELKNKDKAARSIEWIGAEKISQIDSIESIQHFIDRAHSVITDKQIGNETERMLQGRRAKNAEFRLGLQKLQDMLNEQKPLTELLPYAEQLKESISERYETLEGMQEVIDHRPIPTSEETLAFYKKYNIVKEQIHLNTEKQQN